MFICIKQRTTSLISLYESTSLLLSAKQNLLNKVTIDVIICISLSFSPGHFLLTSMLLRSIAIAFLEKLKGCTPNIPL